MLEAPIRSRPKFHLAIAGLGAAAILFCSCATEKPRTALISDPDAKRESSIPWNKPAKWESGANMPGGIGGAGGGLTGNSPGN